MFERPQEELAPIGPFVRPTRELPQTGLTTAEAAYTAQRSALPEEDIGASREAAEIIRSFRSLHTRLRSPGAQTASRHPPATANENLGEPYREYQQSDNGGAPLPADALIPLRSNSAFTGIVAASLPRVPAVDACSASHPVGSGLYHGTFARLGSMLNIAP
jgi:hypothetical protein